MIERERERVIDRMIDWFIGVLCVSEGSGGRLTLLLVSVFLDVRVLLMMCWRMGMSGKVRGWSVLVR